MHQQAGRRFADYLTVGEAAEFLGVSPWTLRNWDKAGKLKPQRHPQNGYRIYKHEDLQSILDGASDGKSEMAPRFDWSDIGPSEHFVQFYESDAFLVDSVSGYLAAALNEGECGVIIATGEHRAAIQRKLKANGVDVAAALKSGRFVALDAAQTLAKFMVDGSPDAARFEEIVGSTIKMLCSGGRKVRAFGEMVALLWADGNRAAAIALEELWNGLAKVHSFALLCAYPIKGFSGESQGAPFEQVCTCHSRVIPAESYSALPAADEQLREISALQQKAQSLQAEIAHRQAVEESLRQSEQRHRQAAADLHEAKVAAECASKAKDQFLAVLSHELRTPLTPVLMSAASMETAAGLSPQMREDLAMIRRNIALETRLIDDLLDLSRVVNGKIVLQKQKLHVHPLIRNVIEMVSADARAKSLTMEIDLKATNDKLNADPARVHQVIWNLLHNAIKFTPANGTVSMRTADVSTSRLMLEVCDTGIGIEPEALPCIFNAFDQGGHAANRSFGGLGLGLAIAKAMVDLHDGVMSAHSDGAGKGARFTIHLPTITTAQKSASPRRSAARPSDHAPLRILLVEDHADTLKVMRRLLEMAGYSIVPANNVAEAVQLVQGDGFDLLISDIGLPDGSGLDIVKAAQARHPNLPAIALTGYGMEQDVRGSHEAGFSAHVTKPVDLDRLKCVIQELTAARR